MVDEACNGDVVLTQDGDALGDVALCRKSGPDWWGSGVPEEVCSTDVPCKVTVDCAPVWKELAATRRGASFNGIARRSITSERGRAEGIAVAR